LWGRVWRKYHLYSLLAMKIYSKAVLILAVAALVGCSKKSGDDDHPMVQGTSAQYSGEITSTITVPNNQTVTLSGVNCHVTSGPGILCLGNATIIMDGVTNITSNHEGHAGIEAGGPGTTLTIKGGGSMTVNGAGYAAGIGTAQGKKCGTITICGGDVRAKGGMYAAGIGGGLNSSFEQINITNEIKSVVAIKGSNAKAPIGEGFQNAPSGPVYIFGSATRTPGESEGELIWSVTSSPASMEYDTWTLIHRFE